MTSFLISLYAICLLLPASQVYVDQCLLEGTSVLFGCCTCCLVLKTIYGYYSFSDLMVFYDQMCYFPDYHEHNTSMFVVRLIRYRIYPVLKICTCFRTLKFCFIHTKQTFYCSYIFLVFMEGYQLQ